MINAIKSHGWAFFYKTQQRTTNNE